MILKKTQTVTKDDIIEWATKNDKDSNKKLKRYLRHYSKKELIYVIIETLTYRYKECVKKED